MILQGFNMKNLKTQLVNENSNNKHKYADDKTAFVASILQKIEQMNNSIE